MSGLTEGKGVELARIFGHKNIGRQEGHMTEMPKEAYLSNEAIETIVSEMSALVDDNEPPDFVTKVDRAIADAQLRKALWWAAEDFAFDQDDHICNAERLQELGIEPWEFTE